MLAVLQQRPVLGRDSSFGRPLRQAAWLLALLWMLPLSEQIVHRPGNLSRIVEFFFLEGEEGRVSTAAAWRAWSYSLMGLVRPDLQLPIGHVLSPCGTAVARSRCPRCGPAPFRRRIQMVADEAPVSVGACKPDDRRGRSRLLVHQRSSASRSSIMRSSGSLAVGLVVLAVAASAAFLWTHTGEGGRPPGTRHPNRSGKHAPGGRRGDRGGESHGAASSARIGGRGGPGVCRRPSHAPCQSTISRSHFSRWTARRGK